MRRVTIIGAGRTGRGMFGELFFSEGGFDLAFADVDAGLVEGLRRQGSYVVEQVNLERGTSKTTTVEGFSVFDVVHERDAYLRRLATSELIAVAVFPSSFDAVARDLVDMARVRRARGVRDSAAVILGGNFVGLREHFSRAIRALAEEEGREFPWDRVALVTSKANRKVSFSSRAGAAAYALEGDDKAVLPVEDRFCFGDGYAYPSFFVIRDDVELSMVEKIWSENLLHCSLGFMGAFRGFAHLNDAACDEKTASLARLAWLEGRRALRAEYGLAVPSDAEADAMMRRFASPFFRDKTGRVVRQPMRKLSRNDRFLGPALLCLRHGIQPLFILRAAAHGLCFVDESDAQSVELARMVGAHGLEGAIERVAGLDASRADEAAARDLLAGFAREVLCLEGLGAPRRVALGDVARS